MFSRRVELGKMNVAWETETSLRLLGCLTTLFPYARTLPIQRNKYKNLIANRFGYIKKWGLWELDA